MFERYTEHARRVIFFARYEASAAGSQTIEPEHLLLGLLREDSNLRGRVSHSGIDAIRKAIESLTPHRERTSTSVDLPLSHDAKRALAFCAEEAERLGQKHIDAQHIVLGLLRQEGSVAASQLAEHGIDLVSYRATAAMPVQDPTVEYRTAVRIRPFDATSAWEEPATSMAAAPSLQPMVDSLVALVDRATDRLDGFTDAYGATLLKRKQWSRKQALGHLVDWSLTHQQWFARALTEPKLVAHGYPLEEWVEAQKYAQCRWQDLVDLWVCSNRVLIHVVTGIPEQKTQVECRIGLDEPITLAELVARYVRHCEDLLGQILARL